jgi:hypothetical protein
MLFSHVLEHLIKRAPLAAMTRMLLERSLDAEHINALFAKSSKKQYTRIFLFSDIVALMCMVVTRMHRSPKAAYDAYKEVLPKVSFTAFYNKLKRVDLSVMSALIHENALRLGAIIDELKAHLPPLIPGFQVRIVDGNAIAATDRRLKELREIESAPLPGKSLVVFDYERDITRETIPCEDGHAQERSLFGKLLTLVGPNEVWIADRNFCTKAFLEGIVARGAHFLIRQHANIRLVTLSKLVRAGTCENGSDVFEQKVRLGTDPKGLVLRRIVVRLKSKTRDGDSSVAVLTSLPPDKISAVQVAETYRKRWRVETMFRDLTLALRCEVKELANPRAALFVFTVALLAANILATIRAAIRAAHGTEVAENVSTYGLVNELEGTFRSTELFSQSDEELPGSNRATHDDGPTIVSDAQPEHDTQSPNTIAINTSLPANAQNPKFGIDWKIYAALPIDAFVSLLLRCAKGLKLQRYPKAKPRKRSPQSKRKTNKKKPHVSTHRILNPQDFLE